MKKIHLKFTFSKVISSLYDYKKPAVCGKHNIPFSVPLKCICEPENKTVKYISEKPEIHTCAWLEDCAAYSHPEGVYSRMVGDHGF